MTPMNREEVFLNGIAEGAGVDLTPMTREELWLDAIIKGDTGNLEPMTRKELFYKAIAEGGSGGCIEEAEYTLSDGYYNSDGTIHVPSDTNKEKYTSKIAVKEGDAMLLMLRSESRITMWCAVSLFDTNGDHIERVQLNNSDNTKYDRVTVAGNGIGYMAFSIRTYGTVKEKIYKTNKVEEP